MTFIDNIEDESSTIREYFKDGYNYSIEYLDGSISEYYSCSNKEEDKIKSKMIDQAISRQNRINLKSLKFAKNRSQYLSLLSCLCSLICMSKNEQELGFAMFLILAYNLYNYIARNQKLRELKKYKLFLELTDNLDTVNSSSYMKNIDPDNIFQAPLDINTVDDFTYRNVKMLYNNYKNVNKK